MQKNDYYGYINSIVPAPTQEFPNRSFQLQKVLGEGGEGGVYLAKQQSGNQRIDQVAFKLQYGLKEYEKLFIDYLINYQAQNENEQSEYPQFIIKIYDMFSWNNQTVIIMELGNENLYEYMKSHKTENLISKGEICKQLLKSLQMLHQIGYAHRDIKPENYILVNINGNYVISVQLKKEDYKLKKLVLRGDENNYTEKIDIWSLGCVFYEIIEDKVLFDGQIETQIQQSILESNKLLQNQQTYMQIKINQMNISQIWKNALINMLQYDPDQRSSVQQVIDTVISCQIANINISNYQSTWKPINKEINPYVQPLKFTPIQNKQIEKDKVNQMQLEDHYNQFQSGINQQKGNLQFLLQTENIYQMQHTIKQQNLFNQFKNQNFQKQQVQKVVEENQSQQNLQLQNIQQSQKQRKINMSRSLHSQSFQDPQEQQQNQSKQQVETTSNVDMLSHNSILQSGNNDQDISLQDQGNQNKMNRALNNQVAISFNQFLNANHNKKQYIPQQQESNQMNQSQQSIEQLQQVVLDSNKIQIIQQKLDEKNQEIIDMRKRMDILEQTITKNQNQQANQNQYYEQSNVNYDEDLNFDDEISSMMLRTFIQIYNSKIEKLVQKGITISKLKKQHQKEIKSIITLIEKFERNLNAINQDREQQMI